MSWKATRHGEWRYEYAIRCDVCGLTKGVDSYSVAHRAFHCGRPAQVQRPEYIRFLD